MKDRYLVIDVETTGLVHHDYAEVCALAMVLVRNNQPADTFYQVICPEVMDERALPAFEVNGFNPERLAREGVAPHVAWSQARDFVASCQTRYATSYNTSFDAHFLNPHFPHLWWLPCLMAEAARKARRKRYFNLAGACAHYGVQQFLPAHHASNDARSAAALACVLWR